MGYDRDDILEQIEKNIPTKCERCGARLYFKGSGRYVCQRCHIDYYDDFGLIKKYIDENGPAPAVEISVKTGVKLEVIDMLLEKGRLEMPGELKEAERCERCGALFPIGRYCKECIEDTSKGIMNIFKNEENLPYQSRQEIRKQKISMKKTGCTILITSKISGKLKNKITSKNKNRTKCK